MSTSKPVPPPAPPFGMPISYEQARQIAEAARQAALAIKVPKAIAVVEPTGDLVFFLKMDGAPYSAVELAQKKAIAAARYRRPTEFFFDALRSGHTFFMTFPGMVAGPGGVPIIVEGKLVGAIGVSGGSAEQDIAVSSEALKILG